MSMPAKILLIFDKKDFNVSRKMDICLIQINMKRKMVSTHNRYDARFSIFT